MCFAFRGGTNLVTKLCMQLHHMHKARRVPVTAWSQHSSPPPDAHCDSLELEG